MAEEANGLPYNSGNASGIGAVYFDKTIEPLKLHQENLKTLDDTDDFYKMQKLKAAQDEKNAKLAQGIVADLAINPNGAMSEDIENLVKPRMKTLLDGYGSIVSKYGGDMAKITRSPEYLSLKNEINDLKGTIVSSKDNNSLLTKTMERYYAKPDDWEEQSLVNAAMLRTAKSPAERNEMLAKMGGSPLIPVQPKFFEELGKRKEKGLYKPSEISKGIFDPVTNMYGTEDVIKYTPEDLDRIAQAIYFGEPKMVRAATNDFNLLGNKAPALRDQIIADAQKNGVDPVQQFIRKQIEDSEQIKSKYSNMAWSPWQKEDASGKADEGFVNYVIEQGGNLLTGNKDVYTVGGGFVSGSAQVPGMDVSFAGNKPFYSDKLQGMSSGTFTNTITYSDGTKGVGSSPNIVLSFKYINGKPFIKTTETVFKKESGEKQYSEGVPIDDEGYKPASPADIEKIIAANSKDPAKAIEKYRSSLIRQKAYPNKIAKPESTVPSNGIGVKTEVKVETKPTVAKEKLFVVNGKAYKESALKKQGYDISTLKEYTP